MASATDQQAHAYRDFVNTHPEAQALIRRYRAGQYRPTNITGGPATHGKGGVSPEAQLDRDLARLAQVNGIPVPHDWEYDPKTGQIAKRSYFQRNADWIMPAAIIGGGLAAGSVGGGASIPPPPPAAGTTATTAATGASAASTAATAARTASDVAGAGSDWLRVLAPLLGLGTSMALRAGASSNDGGFSPEIQSQIGDLLGLQKARIARQTPVHEAAMALAQNLAPTSTSSPRLQSAIQASAFPRQDPATDPAILAAVSRLMGR